MLTEQAEGQLCFTCDKVDAQGAPDTKYIGRGVELKRQMKPVMPPQKAELGEADMKVRGRMWFHVRAAELAAYMLNFIPTPTGAEKNSIGIGAR